MKTLKDVLSRFSIKFQDLSNDERIVFWLIHEGKELPAKRSVMVKDMRCPTCGSGSGYTCLNRDQVAWFCGNDKCLKESCKISKMNLKWP